MRQGLRSLLLLYDLAVVNAEHVLVECDETQKLTRDLEQVLLHAAHALRKLEWTLAALGQDVLQEFDVT